MNRLLSLRMAAVFNQFANVLTVFGTSTVLSLTLEWMFGDYVKTTDPHDVWLQFAGGFAQFFIYVVAAPQVAFFLYSPSVYGPPGMTASLCFFWGFLFQTNMRAKIIDWYQVAVDPSLYKPKQATQATGGGDCTTCAQ